MTIWLLFVLQLTAPGTIEVTAHRFDNKPACERIAQAVRAQGALAVCERQPSA